MADSLIPAAIFILYVIAVYIATRRHFKEGAVGNSDVRTEAKYGPTFRMIARPIVFFVVTSLIWVRSDLLLYYLRIPDPSGAFQLVVSAVFGVYFAFWPTTALRSILFTLVLIHIRALFLIVEAAVTVVWLSIAIAVCGTITLLPILGFSLFALLMYGITGGEIDLSNVLHSVITIGVLAVFLFTARFTWNLLKYAVKNFGEPIENTGKAFLQRWRDFCVGLYNSVSAFPYKLGSFLGGDVT